MKRKLNVISGPFILCKGNDVKKWSFEFLYVFPLVTGAREFVRISRHSEPDNLLDSAIAGFGTGAILGRLQG